MMRFLSVCSGIEAASVAWLPLGWECAAVAEIDPFCCAVLAHHYPGVPNLGDMTAIDGAGWLDVDVLVGGTPCQSFSIAGLRGSLSDERGNLSLEFVRLAHAIPSLRWAVWENVPGVLNTPDNAFGCFLAGLVGADAPLRSPLERGRWPNVGMVAGPLARACWRVLCAQYFGLAQRRERVFVVAGFGDGADPAAVLFERASLRRDPPPRREAGASVAGTLGGSSPSGGWRVGSDEAAVVAGALLGGHHGPDDNSARAGHLVVAYRTSPNCGAWETGDRTGALTTGTDQTSHVIVYGGNRTSGERETPLVAIHENQRGELTMNDTAGALKTGGGKPGQGYPATLIGMQVRRLTPVECARLQGFPDAYLDITYRGKPAADGPKYRAIGNSMATKVMRWIGERIVAAEETAGRGAGRERSSRVASTAPCVSPSAGPATHE